MVKISVKEDDEWQSAFISDNIYDSLDMSTPDTISNDSNNNFFDLFEKYGIGSIAARVNSATGAESLDDLMLLDGNGDMVDEAARNMGMKLIHKAKLNKALKHLHEKKSCEDTTSDEIKKNQQKEKDAITGKGAFIVQTPTECTVVCIDRSFSMGSALEEELSWGENSSKTLDELYTVDASWAALDEEDTERLLRTKSEMQTDPPALVEDANDDYENDFLSDDMKELFASTHEVLSEMEDRKTPVPALDEMDGDGSTVPKRARLLDSLPLLYQSVMNQTHAHRAAEETLAAAAASSLRSSPRRSKCT